MANTQRRINGTGDEWRTGAVLSPSPSQVGVISLLVNVSFICLVFNAHLTDEGASVGAITSGGICLCEPSTCRYTVCIEITVSISWTLSVRRWTPANAQKTFIKRGDNEESTVALVMREQSCTHAHMIHGRCNYSGEKVYQRFTWTAQVSGFLYSAQTDTCFSITMISSLRLSLYHLFMYNCYSVTGVCKRTFLSPVPLSGHLFIGKWAWPFHLYPFIERVLPTEASGETLWCSRQSHPHFTCEWYSWLPGHCVIPHFNWSSRTIITRVCSFYDNCIFIALMIPQCHVASAAISDTSLRVLHVSCSLDTNQFTSARVQRGERL